MEDGSNQQRAKSPPETHHDETESRIVFDTMAKITCGYVRIEVMRESKFVTAGGPWDGAIQKIELPRHSGTSERMVGFLSIPTTLFQK
jgi:hypothetical protein